jgi:hypothetical protein
MAYANFHQEPAYPIMPNPSNQPNDTSDTSDQTASTTPNVGVNHGNGGAQDGSPSNAPQPSTPAETVLQIMTANDEKEMGLDVSGRSTDN